jgi:hypothetical protein
MIVIGEDSLVLYRFTIKRLKKIAVEWHSKGCSKSLEYNKVKRSSLKPLEILEIFLA